MCLVFSSPGYCETYTHEFNTGPMDITRKSGEEYIYIPCPYWGEHSTIWEINGVIYGENNLPEGFTPYASGLLINRIEDALDGTRLRCLYPSESGTHTQSSSYGTLRVATDY